MFFSRVVGLVNVYLVYVILMCIIALPLYLLSRSKQRKNVILNDKIKRFEINLNSENSAYYPGQMVEGICTIELRQHVRINELYLLANGVAVVDWIERTESLDVGDHNFYREKERYLSQRIVLEKKGSKQEGSLQLGPGQHNYPFQFLIPNDCPASFLRDGVGIGRVVYDIQGTLKFTSGKNRSEHTRKEFYVVTVLDLNRFPACYKSYRKTEKKEILTMWCSSAGEIECTLELQRLGFVPGEFINFSAYIENRSSRAISSSYVVLVMVITVNDGKKRSHSMKLELTKLSHGRIEKRDTHTWIDERLPVPPTEPSYLLGCKLICIQYFVQMVVVPAGISGPLKVIVPVAIGNVPLDLISPTGMRTGR